MGGGTDDQQVAEADVEDDLGRHPGVDAREHDRPGLLPGGDLSPASRVLVRVGGLARRPAPVALFE
ncbi:hypothetical protein GCM10009850_033990 [Nonomuraea monospora]|uniref:Uncharacterized protein n=1 Tax=Nonomuraea monospora TaxID=568818 RepID=A0ABP5P850_9ACTN